MVPAKWHWPVGLSLSAEAGYQKLEYSTDDWNLELRPIIDKSWRKWYVSFNPTFEKSLHGLNAKQGFEFAPNLKLSYSVTKIVAMGFEYYGGIGNPAKPDALQQQQHQLYLATDLELNDDWEFNAGYGLGFTQASDNSIFKLILGYRFHRHENKKQPLWYRNCLDKINTILY